MRLKKILKVLGMTLISLVMLLLIGVSVIWMVPETVLTQERVQGWVQELEGSVFSEVPQDIELSFSPHGLLGKHVRLVASRFCLVKPQACFSQFELEFRFTVTGLPRVRIDEIGPIQMVNESLTYNTQKAEDDSEPSKTSSEGSSDSILDVVDISSALKIKPIRALFPDIRVINPKPQYQGSVIFSGDGPDSIDLKAQATGRDGLKAQLNVASQRSDQNANTVQVDFSLEKGFFVKGTLQGMFDFRALTGKLTGAVFAQGLAPGLELLELQPITIERQDHFIIDAPIQFSILPKLRKLNSGSSFPKSKIEANGKGHLHAEEKDHRFQYQVKLGTTKRSDFVLNASAEGQFPIAEGSQQPFGLDALYLKAGTSNFLKFSEEIRYSRTPVPAPFSSMGGQLWLELGSEGTNLTSEKIPLSLMTELASEEQILKTQSEGSLYFSHAKNKLQLEGQTQLTQVRFTLPDLDPLNDQPSFKRDPRIQTKKEIRQEKREVRQERLVKRSQKKNFWLDTHWKVMTVQPIQIHYQYIKPYAPVNVVWEIGGDERRIELLPFEVHYLNREAKVERFVFKPDPKADSMAYEGRIVVAKTEYTIYIDVYQASGKPLIKLSSNPPLEESEIVSVLLFNQTSEQLSPGESESVGSTQSAMANRALGLFSVFALSSTPIEAVQYDPSSDVYSARVRLADGLTASVGTNWEDTQKVALRKRIGDNWVISTMFEQDSATESESAKTLLEWFRRF